MYGAAMAQAPTGKRRPIGLAALRGFEAAARRLSFTDAAAELNLTQSSISRQIATLEQQVGKALFVRKTRALLLTPAGRSCSRRCSRRWPASTAASTPSAASAARSA